MYIHSPFLQEFNHAFRFSIDTEPYQYHTNRSKDNFLLVEVFTIPSLEIFYLFYPIPPCLPNDIIL